MTFSTPEQAIAEALFLGLMAPGESEAQVCAVLAEEIAADHESLIEQAVELAEGCGVGTVRAGDDRGRGMTRSKPHRLRTCIYSRLSR